MDIPTDINDVDLYVDNALHSLSKHVNLGIDYNLRVNKIINNKKTLVANKASLEKKATNLTILKENINASVKKYLETRFDVEVYEEAIEHLEEKERKEKEAIEIKELIEREMLQKKEKLDRLKLRQQTEKLNRKQSFQRKSQIQEEQEEQQEEEQEEQEEQEEEQEEQEQEQEQQKQKQQKQKKNSKKRSSKRRKS
ncbi:hypothetical protein DLAC_05875 [Tieghemostelium lacteum]|uniref:Uncharacterized protein n=1 Tax=Tieghemostelium lacteum TaxID=361077 RepID=A0A151ZGX6_TIELA|nr:hypothetical protein DLAC_05875 [Tieghemostelium lacteum]|eukprot:KYQ93231.1 hypothetical protein DLAC_05875 [Tieghemostelium lacteum]